MIGTHLTSINNDQQRKFHRGPPARVTNIKNKTTYYNIQANLGNNPTWGMNEKKEFLKSK